MALCFASIAGAAQSSASVRGKSAQAAESKTEKDKPHDSQTQAADPPPQPLVVDIGKSVSTTPWTIVALLTLLTLLPAVIMATTPFVRLLVIFHFLRQALGTQGIPTNQTLIGLSLFLTYFI